jgi:crotonobetainyl-CoA:carnitine CoA-transferase CaiB-like acyl-CoA transferase
LGEHSVEVLKQFLGLSEGHIGELREQGVFGQAPA